MMERHDKMAHQVCLPGMRYDHTGDEQVNVVCDDCNVAVERA